MTYYIQDKLRNHVAVLKKIPVRVKVTIIDSDLPFPFINLNFEKIFN